MITHSLRLSDEEAEVLSDALFAFTRLDADMVDELELEYHWHQRAASIAESLLSRLPQTIADIAA